MSQEAGGATSTARPRLTNRARLRWDAVRGKHVLLFPEGLLVLNETAAAVLDLCDGQRCLADIAAELAARYERPADVTEQEIRTLIHRLTARRLVEVRVDDD